MPVRTRCIYSALELSSAWAKPTRSVPASEHMFLLLQTQLRIPQVDGGRAHGASGLSPDYRIIGLQVKRVYASNVRSQHARAPDRRAPCKITRHPAIELSLVVGSKTVRAAPSRTALPVGIALVTCLSWLACARDLIAMAWVALTSRSAVAAGLAARRCSNLGYCILDRCEEESRSQKLFSPHSQPDVMNVELMDQHRALQNRQCRSMWTTLFIHLFAHMTCDA